MNAIYRDIKVFDYYRTDDQFPIPDRGGGQIVQDGIILNMVLGEQEDKEIYHTELNCYGFFFYCQDLLKFWKKPNGKIIRVIRESEILSRLDQFFDSATIFFEKIGFWESIFIDIKLANIRNCAFGPYETEREVAKFIYSPDSTISYDRILYNSKIRDIKDEIIYEAVRKIRWGFGSNVTRERLTQLYKELKRN